ncbi:MAG: hypothetical protein Q9187_007196 [Circinaria calcarea]
MSSELPTSTSSPSGQPLFEPTTSPTNGNNANTNSNPIHNDTEPFTSGLTYPYERKTDDKGRSDYLDHEARKTSWLDPLKLAGLKTEGVLTAGGETVWDDNGQAVFAEDEWILPAVAEGPNQGQEYWVDYRRDEVDWVGPEDKRIARAAAAKRKAEREGLGMGKERRGWTYRV